MNRLAKTDAALADACAADGRYPVLGASLQRRGGVARHDAVAWGYARAADALGVELRRAREDPAQLVGRPVGQCQEVLGHLVSG